MVIGMSFDANISVTTCDLCDGTGKWAYRTDVDNCYSVCKTCGGTGHRIWVQKDGVVIGEIQMKGIVEYRKVVSE